MDLQPEREKTLLSIHSLRVFTLNGERKEVFFINIAILFFGIVAILSAFGGATLSEATFAFDDDRWSPDKVPFFKRITPRGWTSLFCLVIALGLGIIKDKIHQQTVSRETSSRKNLEADNTRLHERIGDHVKEIIGLREQVDKANQDISEMSDDLQKKQLVSFEIAFKRAFKPPRAIDDAVVLLDGRERIPIPSRYREQMLLYWGDQFLFSTTIEDPPVPGLDSVKLEAGGKTYSLFDNPAPGPFKKLITIAGNSPKPLAAEILNPLQLSNITLKVFVRTAKSSKGQDRFRRLILTSRFSVLAKKLYKMTSPDILNVRSNPATTSQIRTRLSSGSFVRSLKTQGGWTEVRTPTGQQGWVLTRLLTEIKEVAEEKVAE